MQRKTIFRNIAPRAGIEPTILACQASVLIIRSPRLPDVPTLPTWLLAQGISADSYIRPPGIVSLLMLTIAYLHSYRQWPYIYIHRVDSTTIYPIACTGSWSQQPGSWV